MRLSTLRLFRVILSKRFNSLDKSLSTSPKTEILTIRTMINTIMNKPMTPSNAQKLGDLGHKYNEMLKLQKRQELHWDEWQKERRALANELSELDETIRLKTPPELFDALPVSESPSLPVSTELHP
ncbi:MAG: hypothetical protein M1469_01155 [Bacteroidetes bacterium]|nr:hypothetical protein [Bacteroidota bacterium]